MLNDARALGLVRSLLCCAAPAWIALYAFHCAAMPPQTAEVDVVPAGWISGDGDMLNNSETLDAAYAFPSLLGTDKTGARVKFITKGPFFLANNSFPLTGDFFWPPSDKTLPTITVERLPNDTGVISVDGNGLTKIQHLSWGEFRELQRGFRRWLAHQSGCWLFCDPKKRFVALDGTLQRFWRDYVLSSSGQQVGQGSATTSAVFSEFARRYVNDPFPLTLAYRRGDTHPYPLMEAVSVAAYEQLQIYWGMTAVYPSNRDAGDNVGILQGVSRPSTGGASQFSVSVVGGRVSLVPRTATLTHSVYIGSQSGFDDSNVAAPFPASWGPLFGHLFVPIFSPIDMYDGALLQRNGENPLERRYPRHLFLLMPTEFAKAEADTAQAAGNVAQFATDASAELIPASRQLLRRFILLGVDEVGGDLAGTLEAELNRLIGSVEDQQMLNGGDGYVMGIFANQTFVELRRHVSVNGRVLEATYPRGAAWADVIGAALPSLLRKPSEPRSPTLTVETVVPRIDDPKWLLRIKMFTLANSVITSVRINEGDDFYGETRR